MKNGLKLPAITLNYFHKSSFTIESINESSLEANCIIYRLFLKVKYNVYLLWPLKKKLDSYSRLWNKRSPWNKRSTFFLNFHIRILIHFYINQGIAVIFHFFLICFQKLINIALRLFQTLEYTCNRTKTCSVETVQTVEIRLNTNFNPWPRAKAVM